jgi:hypothetical protein
MNGTNAFHDITFTSVSCAWTEIIDDANVRASQMRIVLSTLHDANTCTHIQTTSCHDGDIYADNLVAGTRLEREK